MATMDSFPTARGRRDMLPVKETAVPSFRRARTESVRAISTARLRTFLSLHLRPIDVIVYDGPYKEASSRGGVRA